MIIGLFTSVAFAQSYTISGTVKDVNGESIFGASVVIAGTVQGDAAGIDGSFAIEDVTPGNYTLRVSAIGYSSFEQNVTVSSSDVVLNFVLDPESATLEELKVFASRSNINSQLFRKTQNGNTALVKEDFFKNSLSLSATVYEWYFLLMYL
jgi:hypothetical protein